MKHEVFVSYSRKDMAVADLFCAALDAAGLDGRYWIDKSIYGSADFLTEIVANIKRCRIVVFIASANSAESEWTRKELLYAIKHKKSIVAYKAKDFSFEDDPELDFIFTNIQWRDNMDDIIDDCCRLCGVKRTVAEPHGGGTATTAPKTAWYRWLVLLVMMVLCALAGWFVAGVMPDDDGPAAGADKTVKPVARGETAQPEIKASPAPESAAVAATYRVGDYYNVDGVQGVVFEISADGSHGKMVSVDQTSCQWATDAVYTLPIDGSPSDSNGAKNMQTIGRMDGWREKYPAFAWCAGHGEGWYLPAIDELERILLDRDLRKAVNKTLNAHGFVPLSGDRSYWSSTEYMHKYGAWHLCADDGRPGGSARNGAYLVRAVCAF